MLCLCIKCASNSPSPQPKSKTRLFGVIQSETLQSLVDQALAIGLLAARRQHALAALDQCLDAIGLEWQAVDALVHGTTRITNTRFL